MQKKGWSYGAFQNALLKCFQWSLSMETSPFKPLSFSFISSYKRSMGPKKAQSQMLSLALRSDMKVAFQNDSSILKHLFHRWSLNGFLGIDKQQRMSFCSTRWVLCWVLLFQHCLSVFIERLLLEKSHCGGWDMVDESIQSFRNVVVAKQPGMLQTVCTYAHAMKICKVNYT